MTLKASTLSSRRSMTCGECINKNMHAEGVPHLFSLKHQPPELIGTMEIGLRYLYSIPRQEMGFRQQITTFVEIGPERHPTDILQTMIKEKRDRYHQHQ